MIFGSKAPVGLPSFTTIISKGKSALPPSNTVCSKTLSKKEGKELSVPYTGTESVIRGAFKTRRKQKKTY